MELGVAGRSQLLTDRDPVLGGTQGLCDTGCKMNTHTHTHSFKETIRIQLFLCLMTFLCLFSAHDLLDFFNDILTYYILTDYMMTFIMFLGCPSGERDISGWGEAWEGFWIN